MNYHQPLIAKMLIPSGQWRRGSGRRVHRKSIGKGCSDVLFQLPGTRKSRLPLRYRDFRTQYFVGLNRGYFACEQFRGVDAGLQNICVLLDSALHFLQIETLIHVVPHWQALSPVLVNSVCEAVMPLNAYQQLAQSQGRSVIELYERWTHVVERPMARKIVLPEKFKNAGFKDSLSDQFPKGFFTDRRNHVDVLRQSCSNASFLRKLILMSALRLMPELSKGDNNGSEGGNATQPATGITAIDTRPAGEQPLVNKSPQPEKLHVVSLISHRRFDSQLDQSAVKGESI